MTHEQLRNKLAELQNNGFKFLFHEKDGCFRYDECGDELTNDAFEDFFISEMTDIRVNGDGHLMFKMYGFGYTLFATKTVLGNFTMSA